MTMEELGRRIGLSASQVSRIERGLHRHVTLEQLATMGAVAGLDVRLRAYPGPDPALGAPQTAVLGRLVARLPPTVRVQTEVGLPIPTDQRAWDVMLLGLRLGRATQPLPVDIETRFHDPQAQVRRVLLKLRDSQVPAVLLVLADTRLNRDAVRGAAAMFRGDFPVPARTALAALSRGDHPGGSSIVLL